MLAVLVALTLTAPVGGPIARPFDHPAEPFAAGAHRGIDLAARAGATVRAPCSGRVTHAGPVARVGVVTLRCGRHLVSSLPVVGVAVREGANVRRGSRLGALGTARSHRGLHLGVRTAAGRYVDPAALLAADAPPPLAPARPVRPRAPRPAPPPAPPAPRRATAPEGPPAPALPWPAYAGAALLALALPVRIAVRARAVRRRAWKEAY